MYVKHKGFIALMSAVIISAVLLVTVVSGSLSGIYSRSNVLDAELKSRSRAVADACLDQAMLLIANDPLYVGTQRLVFNSLDACELVVTIAPSDNIVIQGSSTPAVTNIKATFDTGSYTLIEWSEVP